MPAQLEAEVLILTFTNPRRAGQGCTARPVLRPARLALAGCGGRAKIGVPMTHNRAWKLVARPDGPFKPQDFQWAEDPLPDLGDGQVLVREIYLSMDPTSRGWASSATYLPPVELGSVMRGFGLGIVEESRYPGLSAGDYVQGLLGWQTHAVMDGAALGRMQRDPGIPLDAYMAVLGHIGATAYFGLLEIGEPKAGETLVVSGAAGAVGSLVGQIGKIAGCRVVGIAGSDEKCRWLTEELGFDAADQLQGGPGAPRLRRECPKGIDVHFENVGGEILDAVLALINTARPHRAVRHDLAVQRAGRRRGPRNLGNVLIQRAAHARASSSSTTSSATRKPSGR